MTTEHTPTPWKLNKALDGEHVVYDPQTQYGIAYTHSGDGKGAHIEDEDTRLANAAFIVRAVNAHDALVKALEDSRHFLSIITPYLDGTQGSDLVPRIAANVEAAQAALRQANGEG